MTHKDALDVLECMPAITRISEAHPAPQDVIVVETDRVLTQEVCALIKVNLQQIWPGRKIVVLDKGMTLKAQAGT